MGEAVLQLPNKSVVLALWKNDLEASEKARSITSSARERVATQAEIGNLKPKAYRDAKKYVSMGEKNEIAALDEIAHLRVYLDWAEEMIKSRGHVGDLVKQAEAAEKAAQPAEPSKPADALSPEEATRAFESTAHLAPTPAEVDAKAEKKTRGKKAAATEEKQPDSVDQFRASLKAIPGGKDVKAKADKYIEQQNEKLGNDNKAEGAALDEGFDELEPPAAPVRPADKLGEVTGSGTYKIVG